MAKRTRNKKRRRAPPPAGRQPLSRQAKIWLTTLSTVLAVATGMFTLRDQIFPRGTGAVALSPAAYQQQVGRVCDELNRNDRHRVVEWKTTKRRLERAKTTIAQRNALLDGVHQTTARSDDALAMFTSLDTPKSLATAQRATEAAWNRNLARLRGYAERLDQAGTRSRRFAAINYLSGLRSSLSRDGVKFASGLDRLGGLSCSLQPPRVIPALTLPPLPARQSEPAVATPQADVGTPAPTTTNTTPPDVATPAPAPAPSGTTATPPDVVTPSLIPVNPRTGPDQSTGTGSATSGEPG